MPIEKASFYKNPHIGLYLRANERIALVPKNIHEKLIPKVREALGVEPVRVYISQSPILGIFCALNSHGCVVSGLAEKQEVKELKSHGLEVCSMDERFAPGNNILANDKAAIINPRVESRDAKRIADCLDVEVFNQPLANIPTVGATSVATNSGLLCFNEMSDVELKMLEKLLGVRGIRGTVNGGSIANSYGVVANSKGALVGEMTSGAEMQRIYEGLFG